MLAAEQGEITILLGDNAAQNLQASLMHAAALKASGQFESIVYINLPFSRKKFTLAARQAFGNGVSDALDIHHLMGGRLYNSIHYLQQRLRNPERTAIIINSWELASSCYQYREALIFKLHEISAALGVTVFVYAMSKPEKVEAGCMNRTGLGKLAVAADAVIALRDEEKAEESLEMMESEEHTTIESASQEGSFEVIDNIINLPQRKEVPGENENLVARNSNDLAHANGHLNRKERRRVHRLATVGHV